MLLTQDTIYDTKPEVLRGKTFFLVLLLKYNYLFEKCNFL